MSKQSKERNKRKRTTSKGLSRELTEHRDSVDKKRKTHIEPENGYKVIKHPDECLSLTCRDCNMAFYRRKNTLLAKAESLNTKFPEIEIMLVITSRKNRKKLYSFASDGFEPITTTKWGMRMFEEHLNQKEKYLTNQWV